MAYKKYRKYKKSQKSGFQKFVSTAGTVASMAMKGLSLATSIAGLVNSEHKHVDTISFHAVDNSTPHITCLTNLAQGTTDQTRIGNSVLAKHLYLKGVFTRDSESAEGTYSQIRIMVIMDTNNENDVAPTIAQLLQNYSSVYVGVSMHNKNFTDRFKVMYDKTILVDQYHPIQKWKYYKEFKVKTFQKPTGGTGIKSTHMTYNGPLSSDLSKNHIYLIEIADIDTHPPNHISHARFGYVDN